MTYLNPQLVCSSEYVERLRHIEMAMFTQHQYWQTLVVTQALEKIRLPIAFIDMLLHKKQVNKVLYLTSASSYKTNIQHSFHLHTEWQIIDILDKNINEYDDILQPIVISSLLEFADLFTKTEQVVQFLAQFDFILVEHSSLKNYELIEYRLRYIYRKAVLELVYHQQNLYL